MDSRYILSTNYTMKPIYYISTYFTWPNNFIFVLIGIILGGLIVNSPLISLSFATFLFVALFFSGNVLKALSLLIIILPIAGISYINVSVFNIPGAKPLMLMTLYVIAVALINNKEAIKIPKYAFIYIVLIIAIFSISFFRSIQHLDWFNYFIDDKLTLNRYILSSYVKPIILFVPLILIVKFAYKKAHIEHIVNTLVLSTTILTALIIILSISENLITADTGLTREYFYTYFSAHTNAIANYYIIALPFLIAKLYIKKNLIYTIIILMTLVSIGLLYSRSAYYIAFISFVLYLILSKKAKYLPFFFLSLFLIYPFLTDNIIERATKGYKSKDKNVFFAGRIEGLWIPLIDEYAHDYEKLIFGNGRFSIRSSEANKKGLIIEAQHPHNMYLEQIMDSGLIGLVIFSSFYFLLLIRMFKASEKLDDYIIRQYQKATIVSIVCYLISGLTDRTFFPAFSNGYLWIVIGIAIVIIRLSQTREELT